MSINEDIIAACGRVERDGLQIGTDTALKVLKEAGHARHGFSRFIPFDDTTGFLRRNGREDAARFLEDSILPDFSTDGLPPPSPVDGEPTNPNHYDMLVKRQKAMERHLQTEILPEPKLMTHCHVAVRAGMIIQTMWFADPITKTKHITRTATPYNHYLLVARGIVDAHDDSEDMMVDAHGDE